MQQILTIQLYSRGLQPHPPRVLSTLSFTSPASTTLALTPGSTAGSGSYSVAVSASDTVRRIPYVETATYNLSLISSIPGSYTWFTTTSRSETSPPPPPPPPPAFEVPVPNLSVTLDSSLLGIGVSYKYRYGELDPSDITTTVDGTYMRSSSSNYSGGVEYYKAEYRTSYRGQQTAFGDTIIATTGELIRFDGNYFSIVFSPSNGDLRLGSHETNLYVGASPYSELRTQKYSVDVGAQITGAWASQTLYVKVSSTISSGAPYDPGLGDEPYYGWGDVF